MKTALGRLRASGLRVTTGRILVLKAIEDAPKKGLGVEQIYHELARAGNSLSLASVYRIMKDLTDEGIFKRSWNGTADDIRYTYWLRSEGEVCLNRLLCTGCQRSVLLDNPQLEDEILRQAQISCMTLGSLQFTIQITCQECAGDAREQRHPVNESSGRIALLLIPETKL